LTHVPDFTEAVLADLDRQIARLEESIRVHHARADLTTVAAHDTAIALLTQAARLWRARRRTLIAFERHGSRQEPT
jgi:hypothetical protein